jgi:hypothetical protein
MTILTFPTLSRRPSNAAFRLRGNTQTHRSPLDGTTQTLEMPGAVWEISVTWNSLEETDWRVLSAFLSNLRGRAGRFTFSPAIFAPRRSVATGTPVFVDAPAFGATLNTEGWTVASGTTTTEIGDWVSYFDVNGRRRLHLCTEASTANSFGESAHVITPPIRVAPVIGAEMEVIEPAGVFMLPDDAPPDMEIRPPMLGRATIVMVEALLHEPSIAPPDLD